MKTVFILIRAVLFAGCFLGFFIWIALRIRAFDGHFGWILPELLEFPGFILMLLGGILALSCVGVFIFRGRGTPAIFDPPRNFVASGPYKYCRNPMYIGGFAMHLGLGLNARSTSILIFFILVLILTNVFVLFFEEPGLRKRFGTSYEEYCKTTPRWIPHL